MRRELYTMFGSMHQLENVAYIL